jgi:hypothetical protein
MRINERGDCIHSATEAVAIALTLQQPAEPPAPETPEDRIARLEAELAGLRTELEDIHVATLAGDVMVATDCDLRDLTIRVAQVQGELNQARRAQAEAEAQAREAVRAEREGAFPQAVEEARRARDEARRCFRDLAVALGRYCTATKRAIELNHQLHATFPDPDRWNSVRDIENRAALDPRHELLDAGYSPLMDFGHDLYVTVPPLLKPATKEDSGHEFLTTLPQGKKEG